MTRTRATARKAGASFERLIADHLATHVDDRIDRRVRNGAKDRGDIAGLRSPHGHRIVVEAKNEASVKLGPWMNEAQIEAANDDAPIALVTSKRHGHGYAGDQWIHCTVDDLICLLTGTRPDLSSWGVR